MNTLADFDNASISISPVSLFTVYGSDSKNIDDWDLVELSRQLLDAFSVNIDIDSVSGHAKKNIRKLFFLYRFI